MSCSGHPQLPYLPLKILLIYLLHFKESSIAGIMERGINGICSQFCPAAPRGARPAFRGAGRPSLIYIYSNKKLYTVKKCVILDIYLSVCAFTSNRDDIFIFQRELNEPTVNKKIIKIWQLICFKLLRLKCRHITTTVKYIII